MLIVQSCETSMAASDEEGEIVAECITNYYLTNHRGDPVSFSILPLQWSEGDIIGDLETQVFLRGNGDDGLQRIYKLVVAWKFELSYVQPEICVLSKEKSWITLQKPWKIFKKTIRTILVTVHWLHFIKKNPEASKKSLWKHLMKEFRFEFLILYDILSVGLLDFVITCVSCSSFEVEPSENDLLEHIQLISEAAKRDKDLAKSKVITSCVYLCCCLV